MRERVDVKSAYTEEMLRDNAVIVRIWNSRLGAVSKFNVGHVSIELSNNRYISLWPSNSGGINMSNPEQDVINEDNHQPDLILRFYGLNTAAIQQEAENFCNKVLNNEAGWSLIGYVSETPSEDVSHSCASLALSLLLVGGLGKYFTKNDEIKISSKASSKSSQASSMSTLASIGSTLTSTTGSVVSIVECAYHKVLAYPSLERLGEKITSTKEALENASEFLNKKAQYKTFVFIEMLTGPFIPSPDYVEIKLKQAKNHEMTLPEFANVKNLERLVNEHVPLANQKNCIVM
ncbi:MAG: hypothetical protein J0H68_05260 [Sphingobacteriia bacterium]|nr:hypothetical protein [Sphingobacteriia bacterium]